jgi:predicted metalloendopeptidase
MNIMPYMIDEYQQKRVEFRKILQGIQSERNRWNQCVEWTNKKLGMAVGALFIRDNFNHDSKVGVPAPLYCRACAPSEGPSKPSVAFILI